MKSPSVSQAALTRALKSLQAAGVMIAAVELRPDGSVCILTKDGGLAEPNEWDEVLAAGDMERRMVRAFGA